MPTAPAAPFTLEQIGTGTARFPSGVPIPTHTDQMVDPYFKSRMPKEHQVDCLLFWPQQAGTYPGLVLLHDWWGLTGQMKDLGARLACEGYMAALFERQNENHVITDINSCCEYLNTHTVAKKNIHGVVGYGMGGTYALRFACHRKRLRAAVSYYGKIITPGETMKGLFSPVLYHQAGKDTWTTEGDVEELRSASATYAKRIDIHCYPDASHGFCNEMKPLAYDADSASLAWERTAGFLKSCFQGT
jgi:carboxymethylenebutenolidase